MGVPSDDPGLGTPVGRRVFLSLVGLGAAAVAAGGPLSSLLSRVQGAAAAHDPTGLSGLIPGGGWRYYSITGDFPHVAADTYRLRVSGLVRQPLTLSMDDLAARPRTNVVRDFQCVTGWRVPKVHWSGVTLASLITAADPHPSATAVLFRSFDGAYTESLTMKQAMRPDVIVADTFGNGPVPSEHGGPVRMLVAPMYGYKSCKWLSEIRLIPKLVPGFWEQNGYTRTAGSVRRTDAMTHPRERLLRFTPAERFAHRAVATLGLVLTVSGLILYLPELSLLVARRTLVEGVHVVAGLLLPLPVFAALLSPAFRADVGALNRFLPSDWAWLRDRDRRTSRLPVGKFNAGQKLAAAAFAAAGVVLFGTGVMLLLPTQLSLSDGLRQGATIVHDATTLALVALLVGHASLAYRHPEARRALRTGTMDIGYAEQNYPEWAGRGPHAASGDDAH